MMDDKDFMILTLLVMLTMLSIYSIGLMSVNAQECEEHCLRLMNVSGGMEFDEFWGLYNAS
jgi:hypothetical protein